ncbi:transposable element Tcb1 transposase [Trichonephila clavipes]|nr:transposable element Tcb1 transposase [Trichonephila clavipes]
MQTRNFDFMSSLTLEPLEIPFVFQDDNARSHRSRLVENMLEAETIQRMEWTACCPDLNPIEHVWDMFGRRIAARPRPNATFRGLRLHFLRSGTVFPKIPKVSPHATPFARLASSSKIPMGKKSSDAKDYKDTAKTVRDFCSAQHMQLLLWPAYSPDISHIEHVWDLVGRRLARDPRPAGSKDELFLRIKQYGIIFYKQTFKIYLTPCHVV